MSGSVTSPAGDQLPRRSWVEQIMGMPVSVLARGDGARSAQAETDVRTVFRELREIDAIFSPYQPGSAVSRLLRREISMAECVPLVREVAARCDQARELTGGLFDPIRPDSAWDPSGLVKGWAVERILRHLPAEAGLDWCVNAGGDVAVVCPTGRPFRVGIQDPYEKSRIAAVVPCAEGGVATSGAAVRGPHIYDPRTGVAAALRWGSVTVAGPSLEAADVLATAAFIAGESWLEVLQRVPGYEGLAIARDGAVSTTVGWPRRIDG